MDAIEMLKIEHRGAKGLMEEVLAASGAKRKGLFEKLKGELEAHDRIEEEVFYPAVLAKPKAAGFPAADKKAHKAVEALLDGLLTLPVDDPAWAGRFTTMQTQLLGHVAEEETKFFVAIRGALSPAELEQLGKKMATAKKELVKAG